MCTVNDMAVEFGNSPISRKTISEYNTKILGVAGDDHTFYSDSNNIAPSKRTKSFPGTRCSAFSHGEHDVRCTHHWPRLVRVFLHDRIRLMGLGEKLE